MNTLRSYTPAITLAILMCIVVCIIYPHYHYYIDPDGTSYLTISQRYASGDYHAAINGYWSPWSCWLTAMIIRMEISAIPASIIVNSIGGIGFLFVSQSFFLKFNVTHKLQWLLCGSLAWFLCFSIYAQSFDDLWECFFLLGALRVMLLGDFKHKPVLWVVYGIIGSLAYFAKAYSFPFFILNTFCCTWFICRGNKPQWLKTSAVSIGVMVLFSLPWIYLLHSKYGIWTTSTAGSLNMSWYLVGHPHFKQGIDLLIPPAYKDSPYYWEDPYLANGDTPHFWSSWYLLGFQFLRIAQNMFKLLVSMLQLSVLFPVIAIISLYYLKTRNALFKGDVKILIISCLLFPLGYVLINFESRYIWYMLPLGMVLGALLVQNSPEGRSRSWFIFILPVTFLIYPVRYMVGMYDEGVNEYKLASQLKQQHIQGSFASIAKPGRDLQRVERLAYFSGNQFYSVSKLNVSKADILPEMRKYHIAYYFAFPPDSTFVDEQGRAFPEVAKGGMKGIRIFVVNP